MATRYCQLTPEQKQLIVSAFNKGMEFGEL
jgi:magnesium-transporting ATPase (P-type)